MSSVLTSDRDGVRTITLNRPDRLNALDEPCRVELLSALSDAAASQTVGAVIITGQGRAFCTGQDVAAAEELVDADTTVADTYNPLARTIRAMPKPVIAAVNGPAVGAGVGLALCCDLRLMADDAYLACVFSRVGLVPDTGTTVGLVRALGHAWAFEAAVSGRKIGAEEALAARLVNEVLAPADLAGRAAALAARLAAGPQPALALTKELMVAAVRDDEDAVLEMEARFQGVAASSEAHHAAIDAFHSRSRTGSGTVDSRDKP
jgi:2-(1,2-epoxy-1,2-dihydrophenyl)acetyl-CoA isomerase